MKITLNYILVIPVIAFLLLFSVYPFAYQIYLGFTNAEIFNYLAPDWVMFQNYNELLISPGLFWGTMKVTIVYVMIVIAAEFCLGMGYALLVNSLGGMRRVVVAIVLLPMLIAPVFLGALSRLIFHSLVGVVPYYMKLLGLTPLSSSDPVQALLIVAAMDIWQWTPFVFIIILAGLISLPQSVMDAAKVDGATGWKEFRYVTFPMLRRVISVALVFRVMDAFKTFDVPYMLNEGGPGAPVGATTTVSILIYKLALTYNKFGEAAALTILLLIVLTMLINRLLKYVMREEYA